MPPAPQPQSGSGAEPPPSGSGAEPQGRPDAETEELPPAPARSQALTEELPRSASARRRGQGLPVGTVLGERFRLEEEVGRGAQGVVYRARDLALAREVAVKLLRTDAPGQARKRFEREAKTISRLRHPGIVTVYEAGAGPEGALYYAMELVSGRSLEDLLDDEGALPPERLVPIVEAVALAIHHAHDAGLIHRDLKPGNVLLDEEEQRPRIADFGLVSLGNATRLTMTRGVVGTPVYMAPEQAEGERVDRRADVYSLGAILYEGLVGQPPFSGVTPLEIFRRVVEEDPPAPRSLRPDLPEPIERVCLRALEKDPGDRYPTAAAFARDLRRALEGQRLAPVAPLRPVRRRRRGGRPSRWLTAGLVTAGLVGGWAGGATLGRRAPGPEPHAPASAAPTAAIPDPELALKRERALAAARGEVARCLPKAALAWLETLAEAQGDPLAARDAARAHSLRALCLLDQALPGAQPALEQARRLAPEDPWVLVAAAAVDGSAERLEEALAAAPGLIEGWLALARLAPDPLAQALALDQAVGLSQPAPWPVALRRRAWHRLEQGQLQGAFGDLDQLLERVGAREGFEAERALALWRRDPDAAAGLLAALGEQTDPAGRARANLAAAVLSEQPPARRGEGLLGLRLSTVSRTQVTRRLELTSGGETHARTEVEVCLARYVDRVLAVAGERASRVERTYEELRISVGGAEWANDLIVHLGPGGLEDPLPAGLAPRLGRWIAAEGRRFARWGLGPARPTRETWTEPAAELAADFELGIDDLVPGQLPASGRRVALDGGDVRAELVAELRLARWQGVACAEQASGAARGTATYRAGQPWPAELTREGGYAGAGGWPWGGVRLAFEVTVEAQLTRTPR